MSSVAVSGGSASSAMGMNLQLPPVLMPDEAGALQAAISSGNADQVARSCGWSTIRALCLLPTGRSCMEEAVVHNHPGVLRLLIAFTPRVYMCLPIASCRDAFLAAAMKCDALALHFFLTAGVPPDTTRDDGTTALYHVFLQRDWQCIQVLVGAGADVNIAPAGGKSALRVAVHNDDLLMADILLKAGAAVNEMEDNLSHLSYVTLSRTRGTAMVQLLLEHAADPEVTDNGETPLGLAMLEGNEVLARHFINTGADPVVRVARCSFYSDDEREWDDESEDENADSLSMLHLALRHGFSDGFLKELECNPADFLEVLPEGQTMLHFAVKHGSTAAVRFVAIEAAKTGTKGANFVHAHDARGRTALMLAVCLDDGDKVRALLDLGASATAVNAISGMSAAAQAAERGHSDVVAALNK